MQLWSQRCRAICFELMALDPASQFSQRTGGTVATSRFGGVSYAWKLTREHGVSWSAPWSRASLASVTEGGLEEEAEVAGEGAGDDDEGY